LALVSVFPPSAGEVAGRTARAAATAATPRIGTTSKVRRMVRFLCECEMGLPKIIDELKGATRLRGEENRSEVQMKRNSDERAMLHALAQMLFPCSVDCPRLRLQKSLPPPLGVRIMKNTFALLAVFVFSMDTAPLLAGPHPLHDDGGWVNWRPNLAAALKA